MGRLNEKSMLRLCAKEEDGFVYVGGHTERWMEATWNLQKFLLHPANHRLSHLIAEDIHSRISHLGVFIDRISNQSSVLDTRHSQVSETDTKELLHM